MRILTFAVRSVLFAVVAWVALSHAQARVCESPLSDIHYTRYTVVEGAVYTETNPSPPTLIASNSYFFLAEVNLKTNYSASGAELIVPDGTPQALEGFNRTFGVEAADTNFSNITASYPAGAYIFIVSNDYTTVNVPNGLILPSTPTLSDYVGDQNINPAKDFTLRWNAFSNGTGADLIDVSISGYDGSFDSPAYGCPGALSWKATSIVIPANTLSPNEVYRVNITFVHVLELNTNSAPFVALLAGTEAETDTQITTGAPGTGTVLADVQAIRGGRIRFDLATTAGTNYVIQSTPSLSSPAWTSLLTTDAIGNSISFTNKPTGSAQFYRVLQK